MTEGGSYASSASDKESVGSGSSSGRGGGKKSKKQRANLPSNKVVPGGYDGANAAVPLSKGSDDSTYEFDSPKSHKAHDANADQYKSIDESKTPGYGAPGTDYVKPTVGIDYDASKGDQPYAAPRNDEPKAGESSSYDKITPDQPKDAPYDTKSYADPNYDNSNKDAPYAAPSSDEPKAGSYDKPTPDPPKDAPYDTKPYADPNYDSANKDAPYAAPSSKPDEPSSYDKPNADQQKDAPYDDKPYADPNYDNSKTDAPYAAPSSDERKAGSYDKPNADQPKDAPYDAKPYADPNYDNPNKDAPYAAPSSDEPKAGSNDKPTPDQPQDAPYNKEPYADPNNNNNSEKDARNDDPQPHDATDKKSHEAKPEEGEYHKPTTEATTKVENEEDYKDYKDPGPAMDIPAKDAEYNKPNEGPSYNKGAGPRVAPEPEPDNSDKAAAQPNGKPACQHYFEKLNDAKKKRREKYLGLDDDGTAVLTPMKKARLAIVNGPIMGRLQLLLAAHLVGSLITAGLAATSLGSCPGVASGLIAGSALMIVAAIVGLYGLRRVPNDVQGDDDGLETPGQHLMEVFFHLTWTIETLVLLPFASAVLGKVTDICPASTDTSLITIASGISLAVAVLSLGTLWHTGIVVTWYEVSQSAAEVSGFCGVAVGITVFVMGSLASGQLQFMDGGVVAGSEVIAFAGDSSVMWVSLLPIWGLLATCVGVLGFVAAWKENHAMLRAHIVLMCGVVVFGGVVVVSVLSLTTSETIAGSCDSILQLMDATWFESTFGCSKYTSVADPEWGCATDLGKNVVDWEDILVQQSATRANSTVGCLSGCLDISCCTHVRGGVMLFEQISGTIALWYLVVALCAIYSNVQLLGEATNTGDKCLDHKHTHRLANAGVTVVVVGVIVALLSRVSVPDTLATPDRLALCNYPEELPRTQQPVYSCSNGFQDGPEIGIDCGMIACGINCPTPTFAPSDAPSNTATDPPTTTPTLSPLSPSVAPSLSPSDSPNKSPSTPPTSLPSTQPTLLPSSTPTASPSTAPSLMPSTSPSSLPTLAPSLSPTMQPSQSPSSEPSISPSTSPSKHPTGGPSSTPSLSPTDQPSVSPSTTPSTSPTSSPSLVPSASPSVSPSTTPSQSPSLTPSQAPSLTPSLVPSRAPTNEPTMIYNVEIKLTWNEPPCATEAPTSVPTSCVGAGCTFLIGGGGPFPTTSPTANPATCDKFENLDLIVFFYVGGTKICELNPSSSLTCGSGTHSGDGTSATGGEETVTLSALLQDTTYVIVVRHNANLFPIEGSGAQVSITTNGGTSTPVALPVVTAPGAYANPSADVAANQAIIAGPLGRTRSTGAVAARMGCIDATGASGPQLKECATYFESSALKNDIYCVHPGVVGCVGCNACP